MLYSDIDRLFLEVHVSIFRGPSGKLKAPMEKDQRGSSTLDITYLSYEAPRH